MKRFAVLGVAGFVAPRHLKAIQDVGGKIVVACDPCDSVGLLDSFGYDIRYHKDEAEFWKNVEGEDIDYITICTPNYLHEELIIRGLNAGCDVICEKPLVLSADELDEVQAAEMTTNHNVYTVLQLRLHPTAEKLKAQYKDGHRNAVLKYTTPRGGWYGNSWKGDIEKSGGLLMNIGVHLFDLLLWVFGDVVSWEISSTSEKSIGGILCLERAEIEWYLSIDSRFGLFGVSSTRALWVESRQFDFTGKFADLHTEIYKKILAGEGFGSEEARPSIELIDKLRRK